ncbi:MAG: 50S ribosomal protein L11, partial [Ignavibacteria bacterium]|nr:50S ribosomal protein L11 [Ignavibacteria bacterium]
FIVKSPPTPVLLLKAAGLKSGSALPHKTKVANVKRVQLEEIAKIKMEDLNCDTVESAISMIKGTARSMGITTIE